MSSCMHHELKLIYEQINKCCILFALKDIQALFLIKVAFFRLL